MNQPEMACMGDEITNSSDWAAQQEQDEANEKRAVTEAYERIYRAVGELELLYNCGLPDLRADVRLTELVLFRK